MSCISALAGRYLGHCTTTMSTNYQAVPCAGPFQGSGGASRWGSCVWAPGARLASWTLSAAAQGRGVLLEGAGAELSSTPGSAEAPCEEGETPLASRGTRAWGWRADTPERQCSYLPAFPVSTPSQAVLTSGWGGTPLAPVSLAETLRVQMPLQADSSSVCPSLCQTPRLEGSALLCSSLLLHKHASCMSERVQALLPRDPR